MTRKIARDYGVLLEDLGHTLRCVGAPHPISQCLHMHLRTGCTHAYSEMERGTSHRMLVPCVPVGNILIAC